MALLAARGILVFTSIFISNSVYKRNKGFWDNLSLIKSTRSKNAQREKWFLPNQASFYGSYYAFSTSINKKY